MIISLTDSEGVVHKFENKYETLGELQLYIERQAMFFEFETKHGNDTVQRLIPKEKILMIKVDPNDQENIQRNPFTKEDIQRLTRK